MAEDKGRSAADEDALMAEWEAMADDKPADGKADDVAAEWESMLGGEGEAAETDLMTNVSGRESARVLNQDEIDSLLGFDGGADSDQNRSGIQAILNSGMVSYEQIGRAHV